MSGRDVLLPRMRIESTFISEYVEPGGDRFRVLWCEPVREMSFGVVTDRARIWYCIPIDRERFEFECFLLRSYGIIDDRAESTCLECQIELLLRGKKCLSPFFTEGEVEDFFRPL